MRNTISLFMAFIFGGLLTYGAMTISFEEWGLIVTEFGAGSQLYGMFESKRECLNGRKTYIEEYVEIAGDLLAKKGEKAVMLRVPSTKAVLPITFTCLPISKIRGLSLATGRFQNAK